MPPLKAIEQAQFGGVDSRSNPIVMPAQRWLRCRNWIPRPDGHLDLREGYTVTILEQLSGSSTPSNPGQEIDPASETAHNVSANPAYQKAGFPANFTGTSYVSTAATTTVDSTQMDDSMNPVTPAHVNHPATVHDLLPSAKYLRWHAHLTPWFRSGGGGGHIDIGISCTDPTWVANALTDIWWRGFNGCIIDWHGHGDYTDSSTLLIQSYLAAHSLGTTFCIMIDPGAYSSTATLEAQLSYINTQYLSDPNYLTQSGKPVVLFFGGLIGGVDYAAAKASVGRAMFWMFEGPYLATNTYVDGTFGWPNPWSDGQSNHPTDPYNFAADNAYLQHANVAATTAKPSMPYVTPGFNGTLTKFISWSLGKYMPRDHGKCWLQKCANVNSHVPPNAIGIQVSTWNDWEEGTQVESPINNDIFVTASITGSVLAWSVSGGTGDESTLTGYRVIATQAGRAFLIYTEATGGGKTLDLSTVLGWEGGIPYSIYVTAVGVACVRNQFSNTVTYTSAPAGGGIGATAAYSLCPYTVARPDTSQNPAANPPEPDPIYPNGTRTVLWWQKSAPSQVVTAVTRSGSSFDQGGAAHAIYATYYVNATARFVAGSKVTVAGVTSTGTTPTGFFNGTFPIQSIGNGQLVLNMGMTNGSDPHQIVVYSGTGGTITSVDAEPGVPEMFVFNLTTRDIRSTPDDIPIKGNPIMSTARWQYALGKDGYLYMHNGTDAKFFDGVYLRDIGLPSLTTAQVVAISVAEGLATPPAGTGTGTVNSTVLAWTTGTSGQMNSALPSLFYYAFFDTSTDTIAPQLTPLSGGPAPVSTGLQTMHITGLPVPTPANPNVVGLIAGNINNQPAATFFKAYAADSTKPIQFLGTMSGSGGLGGTVTVTCGTPHDMAVGEVFAIDGAPTVTPWPSNGPFTVRSVIDSTHFTFNAPHSVDAATYNYTFQATFSQLLTVPSGQTTENIDIQSQLNSQGILTSSTGQVQMPYFDDMAQTLLPASAIGGDQPGYQFYACIYNPYTGHVGNRSLIGSRLDNAGDCTVNISGLPDFSVGSLLAGNRQQAHYGYGANNINWGSKSGELEISLPTTDKEWRILIGRTGDGGEVPYACIDSNGNWVTTVADNQTSVIVNNGGIDSNSELPFENFPPPAFISFWREGDRLCGTIMDQPFVWRSASELDATTGIFVGDPAQSWVADRVETFPTAEAVLGGFGYMQESWVFTRGDVAQLSELSGEVAWNGPYNFGIAGRYAFDKGWNGLPFWVSHDKQLCTMLPNSNGPISISTEYETALLARIGDENDAQGNHLGYLNRTEVVYFRDPLRMVDILRIKCVDSNGNPFTVIHDFNLRDDSSPYGQAYEEDYLGVLANDYEQAFIRDGQPYPRMWAAASDGAIYQFYTGGFDMADPSDPTQGFAFTADAINLRYLGGERTALKTIEWYGDELIQWFLTDRLIDVAPDENSWENLTYEYRPVPGDTGNGHWMVDLNRPELIHCYLWAQLTAHPLDASTPLAPMTLSDPPHIPVETYGRLYLAAPLLGDSRGR